MPGIEQISARKAEQYHKFISTFIENWDKLPAILAFLGDCVLNYEQNEISEYYIDLGPKHL